MKVYHLLKVDQLLKVCSHYDGNNDKTNFYPSFSVIMEWVQYPFMKAMAMEAIVTATEKWVSWNQVMVFTLCVTAMAMAMEKIEFFNSFCCRCRHRVNEP